MSAIDAVFLVAFGGPTPGCCGRVSPCPGEAWCFVDDVLGRSAGRKDRVEEVAAHYRHLGGFSPFIEHTASQARALQDLLAARGRAIPVYAGYRHWRPFVKDVLGRIAGDGHRRVLAVVMAPHQSSVSWDWYLKVVAEARDALGSRAPEVSTLDPWWSQEGYVRASAERVRESLSSSLWPAPRAARAELVFTAHSIPVAIARTAPYERQFRETAEAVAGLLDRPFSLAYQSGPSAPTIPWTAPDVCDVLRERAAPGRDFVLAPVGFLVDNVEILYDLDVAAREVAERAGSGFLRAPAVGSHPAFLGMLADRIAARSG